jgi:hypothetical protein
MSLLPQRKKSAEEIAKLRESLGIHGTHPDDNEASAPGSTSPVSTEPVETIVPTHHEATVVHPPESAPPAPLPAPPPPAPKTVHSLKRSERTPIFPAEETPPPPAPVAKSPKAVRSLRKSEQIPVLIPPQHGPAESSGLPAHRHSDAEINEIRRREAIAMLTTVADPRLAIAHPALIAPGYILAITGASCFYFYEFPMEATAACAATALLIAAFIFLRRPISRHHAAFIAVIALFVIVFGALHYFPQLQHAT